MLEELEAKILGESCGERLKSSGVMGSSSAGQNRSGSSQNLMFLKLSVFTLTLEF